MKGIQDVIDDYIDAQPEAVRSILVKIRETIRKAAPDAIEKISWHPVRHLADALSL